jgi:hypothetical protein
MFVCPATSYLKQLKQLGAITGTPDQVVSINTLLCHRLEQVCIK